MYDKLWETLKIKGIRQNALLRETNLAKGS